MALKKRGKTRNKRRRRTKNTCRRRTKNKRRRRKRKKQCGGAFNRNLDQRTRVNKNIIVDTIRTDNFEVCGYVHGGQFRFYTAGPVPSPGEQAYCTPPNAPIIWHTHPHTSKYYPSVEDIIKVINPENQITTSYIFTTKGMWTIQGPKYNGPATLPQITATIKPINDKLYFASPGQPHAAYPFGKARGTNFAPDQKILEYINEITDLNIVNFGLTPWENPALANF